MHDVLLASLLSTAVIDPYFPLFNKLLLYVYLYGIHNLGIIVSYIMYIVHIYMCVYLYIYIYIYIHCTYIYVYIYIYIYTVELRLSEPLVIRTLFRMLKYQEAIGFSVKPSNK